MFLRCLLYISLLIYINNIYCSIICIYSALTKYKYITIQRIKTNNLILKNENANFLKTTQEYQKINKEIVLLEKNFEILFTENEKLQIADFLTGLFSYSYKFLVNN